MSSSIYCRQLILGEMANCVYLIGCSLRKECMVVDPAWDIPAIKKQLQDDGMKLIGILATHYHPDHIGGKIWHYDIPGINEILQDYDVPVYAHKLETEGISKITGVACSALKATEGGDKISIGSLQITLLHTPGHTPGSQCFMLENHLLSGDTLFISGCGRVDLPGGNAEQLYDSLQSKIKKLPHDTLILPGHHYDKNKAATLSQIIAVNPYLQAHNKQEFTDLLH